MDEVGFWCLYFPVQIASSQKCAFDAWHHKLSFDIFYDMKMLPPLAKLSCLLCFTLVKEPDFLKF